MVFSQHMLRYSRSQQQWKSIHIAAKHHELGPFHGRSPTVKSKILNSFKFLLRFQFIEMKKFWKFDGHIFFPCRVIAILMSILVRWDSKIEELSKCHDRTDNPYCLILSKVIIGLELCQLNQRYGCSEDLLEGYGMPKLPKSPKICLTLQKSWFSSGGKSKNFHIERLFHYYM